MMITDLKNWFRGRSRREKIVVWSAFALLLYSVFGFFILPALVKYVLVKKMPVALHRQVAIDKIRINPYTLNLRVQGFDLRKKEGEGAFVAFDELVVNLQAVSLFKRALIVKNLSLSHPQIHLSRHLDNIYNFSDLAAGPADGEVEAKEPGRPLLFSINNIEIAGGEITFDDKPKTTLHQIAALHMAIPAISNLPYQLETYVQPSFSALINGTQMDLGGMVKPFAHSQETSVDVKMAGIDIPSYLAYIPNKTGITLKSALVDLDVKIAFINFDNQGPRLSLTGTVVVREVEVVDGEERRYLHLPRLALEFGDANLLDKKIHLIKVAVDKLALEGWRQKDGSLLPLALLETGGSEQPAAPAAQDNEEGPGLLVDVDLFEMTGARCLFHDEATGVAQPAEHQVEAFDLSLAHFSTAPDNRADLRFALRLNGPGEIKGNGQVGLDPLVGLLDYELINIALKPYQPYIQQQVQVAIGDGALASSGKIAVTEQEGRLALTFEGRAQLDKLAVLDTLHGDDLLAWQHLGVEGVRYDSEPGTLTIEAIDLAGLAAQLLVFTDGSTNIGALPVSGQKDSEEPRQEKAADAGKGTAVAINKVTIDKGQLAFVDRKVRPSYGALLHDLHGTIAGLSSATESQALVDVRGMVNQHAPLVISGRVNPLQTEPFVDLHVDFRDLDLSHASPYTGTYVGYKTEKGKLNLELQYLVDGRQLTGQNKAFLDQFTLGEAVDSPDDLHLPISLAIALLKNRQGEISLDIPVSGNLDDPEFSIGGVVFQVLVNLIAKAATSPFALLGALVPDGEDLQTIAFEPGRAEVNPAAREKLDKIAYVLFERPGLRMDIMGQVDPEPDRLALARQTLDRMIRVQKMQAAKIPQGDKAVEEAVQVSQQEYERYLHKIFTLRLKAAGEAPSPMPQTTAEMAEYIVSRLKVADDQLRLLALDRANQALDYLVSTGGIGAERLFVVEPQALAGQEDGDRAAAVRLVIK